MIIELAIGIWIGCALTTIGIERLLVRSGHEVLLGGDDPWVSAAAYLLVVLFSPFVVVFAIVAGCCAVPHWVAVGWRSLTGNPEWLDYGLGSILDRMVKRRKKCDSRLKNENINKWPEFRLWGTQEDMILDVTEKYHILKSEGVDETQIWPRIDAFRAVFGMGKIPQSPSLMEYVEYRLGIEDPQYLTFGRKLIQRQIDDCETFVRHQMKNNTQLNNCLPTDVLDRILSSDEVERLGARDGDAQFTPTRDDRKILSFKFRIMDGDEVWTYHTPHTRGVALVRKGRSMAHLTTAKDCS
jgi:hypothetical protein